MSKYDIRVQTFIAAAKKRLQLKDNFGPFPILKMGKLHTVNRCKSSDNLFARGTWRASDSPKHK